MVRSPAKRPSTINFGCGSCGSSSSGKLFGCGSCTSSPSRKLFGQSSEGSLSRKKNIAPRSMSSAMSSVNDDLYDSNGLSAFILGRLGLPNPHFVHGLLQRKKKVRRSKKSATGKKKAKKAQAGKAKH